MMDFIKVKEERSKSSVTLSPYMDVMSREDLMTKGHSFYAVWNEEKGLWSTDENDVVRIADRMVMDRMRELHEPIITVKHMNDFDSGIYSKWIKYCREVKDQYHEMNGKIVFANTEVKKEDYASFKLDYPICDMDTPAYDEIMSTLYDPEERLKLEWAIGSIIAGDSVRLQKFIVLYGPPGSGKSTVLNIIQMLFPGYYAMFNSRSLTSRGSDFALEDFKNNPLIAIDHDGDMAHIDDNTKLNQIVSHEFMVVNEKFKSKYQMRFRSFMFIGTNTPVRITDGKSGILRRLIDVVPSGRSLTADQYYNAMGKIPYELGGIASKCLAVYRRYGFKYYDSYIPTSMIEATNDIYNFVDYNYDYFLHIPEEGVQLRELWMRYKVYVDEASLKFPFMMREFREEMKNYFRQFESRTADHRRSVYIGFRKEKFEYQTLEEQKWEGYVESDEIPEWLQLTEGPSKLDEALRNCPAQYGDERPEDYWDECKTVLGELDTTKTHYVRPGEELVVFDLDKKNEAGEKDFMLNAKAAMKFPETYAEVSKGGSGIHLHYWYTGDVKALERLIEEDVEIKVFTGKSALRRRLSKCNNLEIKTISSGIPTKEVKPVLSEETVKSEKGLRNLIQRNLKKEIHPFTKPSIDFIYKILDDAYHNGLHYDVRDMRPAVQMLALSSSHNSDYCLKMVSKMKFASETQTDDVAFSNEEPLVIFDCEVFPNLFVVVWKKIGPECKPVVWINPTSDQIAELVKSRLIGFNNRKYDNHILYARMMGYTEEQLYKLSRKLVGVDDVGNPFFLEAYNLSYTDIYDLSSPANKMSLKKWQIKLKIHHMECPYDWNKPVPEDKWHEVAEYCTNDVLSTEMVWLTKEIQEDFKAREILADWADMTVNTPTNTLTAKIVFEGNKHPQDEFVYPDLSELFPGYRFDINGIPPEEYDSPDEITSGKSIYRGKDPSEGGRVAAKPGMYENVGVLDIGSQHPHSIMEMNLFGDRYTRNFANIVNARMLIKHGDLEGAKAILPEKVHKYLNDPKEAKGLAGGLKGAINPAYGLTSAKFDNPFRDPRNVDNVVAKRGALFMIELQHELEARGYEWIHFKTDSVKIANITDEAVQFVKEFGKKYGYDFEYEHKYEKMCLVNESTYIALVCEENEKPCEKYWEATGTQFQVPYVFKTMFSHEPIEFDDLCEAKSAKTKLFLDFNEGMGEDEHDYRFVGKNGCFCPILDGYGGGYLMRQDEHDETKFTSVQNTKKPGKGGSYRWMESEMVLMNHLEDKIDYSFYDELVRKAYDELSKYCDADAFMRAA